MRNLNLIIYTLCMFQLIYNTTGEVDEQCKVDCACCIDRKCGPGQYTSSDCTFGCIDGYRGVRCYIRCAKNCRECLDYENVYACTACYDGYYPGPARDCTSPCLPGCKTCWSGTRCTSCKEGYYNAAGQNDCNRTDNCNYENNQCVSCKDGYYDTNNLCNSLCPGNCVKCSSNSNCGSCKDGYYKGYQYDNINFPLLNDCTYKCRDNCVRCLSYDRCSVCKTGFYGPNCEKSCSTGCMSNLCDKLTGNCACLQNFAGIRCDKCQPGKYGNMCEKQCPARCKRNVCEKDSGYCTDGCSKDMIIGDKCDDCLTGWYGLYCNMSCSVGCKNQRCEKSYGECSYGCLDNFVGGQCNQCMSGTSCSSEQSAVILLGTILAVSVLVNIILVVTLILRKCRNRANDNSKTKGADYENSGIELECGNVCNVSNHRIVHASNSDTATDSDTVLNSHDYEDLGTIQVSEQEY